MKKIKKLAAILLALAMTMMMAIPTLAAETYTITIDNEKTGHTYEAYQIFTGDLYENEGNSILSNIQWGNGVNSTALLAALKTQDADRYGSCETAADVAYALAGETGTPTAADAEAFADIAAPYLTTVAGSAAEPAEGKYTISGLAAGYYLIKDQDGSLQDDPDSYTSYIVQVLGNVEMEPKSDIPSSQKKVKDINDSTDAAAGDWQDTADYDIGDLIPFQLTATLPSNYEKYDSYTLTFQDTESTGLTFQQDSVKVYIDGQLVSNGYTVVTENIGNETFEVRFENLKTVTADDATTKAGNNSVITVEYSSQLNENAVLGNAGNPNTMNMIYSNNPNGEGTGKTPDDTVIVFTYQVIVNKVDPEAEPLAGAEFTLEKQKYGAEGNTWETVDVLGTDGDLTTFTFKGLDDGVYRLSETKTPAGYNTMDPVMFTVTATHTDATLSLDALTGTAEDGMITFTPSLPQGSLTTTVENHPGALLPETGGMGTTIFFVLGGVLVVGAGVLLVVRLRMKGAEKK